jgi:urease accessory protein
MPMVIELTRIKVPQLSAGALLKLQSWMSPAFPNGAYSYSHGIEWAVELGHIQNRDTLVDWLDADLRYGGGRNDAIFFREAFRCAVDGDRAGLRDVAELASAFRSTAEFVLESSQQAGAYLTTLRQVWPHVILEFLSEIYSDRGIAPVAAIVLGARSAMEGIPVDMALPVFLHSYVANLVSAGVKLVPLGQLAVAELEHAVMLASEDSGRATVAELGSASVMIDFASIAHETQYTRLFRS